MATKVSICNMALTHIGAKNLISDLDTDTTTEAKQCRVFFDEAVRFVLSQVAWGFAKATAALAEVDEEDPTEEWSYLYSLPADCIKFRGIANPVNNYQPDDQVRINLIKNPVPFEIKLNEDRTMKLIYTNQYQAYGHYTADVTDPNLFPSTFSVMVSFYLASLIAYTLTKKKSVKDDMLVEYNKHKLIAEVNDCEEEQQDELPESEFISGR